MTPMHFVWYFRKKRPNPHNLYGLCFLYESRPHAFCMWIHKGPAKKRDMVAEDLVSYWGEPTSVFIDRAGPGRAGPSPTRPSSLKRKRKYEIIKIFGRPMADL